ncbi:MAG: T9SS type A sorting domain-containing protein, partial [Cruoricaptor ignavus]|nr:T9SS type A sorting domain-containing protein [Cruoricaptor ignavus]
GKANTSTAMSEALAQHINFSTGNVLESNNVVFEPSESGTYFFGIQAASNANAGALRIDNISVKEQVVLGNYCIPSLDCTDGDVINNVSFIDIDNTSTCGLGGYGDYTSISTNAEIGKSYPISVTVGNGFAFESVMLWIDFNKNGVFEENEYTYLGTATASSGTTIYSTVSIPGGLEPGERRMRLRVLPAGMSETKWDRACDDTIEKYGEVEDYTINLVDAAPKGCLSGMFGQMPSTIFEPLCDNQAQEIPVDVYAGSYTKVAVKTGVEYVFSSSRDTDFITIGNESGTLVITSGNGSVTWTSNVTGIVRFYTHSDENCNMDGVAMKRFVKCGESALPNNDTCDTAIALSNGDTIIGSTKLATDTVLESAPDLFYTYTGNGKPELVTISLCGSSFDTFLGAYISCDASVFTEITSNDNFCGDQSQITFLSNGYSTYVIVIDGKNGESGDFVLNVSSELVKNPTSCEDYSIQGNNQFGISFGGDFQQKNAIDLPIGATDITFYGMQPVLATGATQINFNIYEDDRGLPGMLIDTKEGTIVNKELYSVLLGLNFDRYTVQFKTPFVAKANKTYWIEVVTDAVGWEVTDVVENSVGNNDAFANANTNFQWQSQNGVHFVFSMLCKDLLSTNDFANQQFSFYPNPVENFLNITSKETIRKVDVYNIQGQKVLNNVKFENGKLNVSSLLKGNYLLQIFFDNGNVETAKIIKK